MHSKRSFETTSGFCFYWSVKNLSYTTFFADIYAMRDLVPIEAGMQLPIGAFVRSKPLLPTPTGPSAL